MITQELYNKGIRCRGICYGCKDIDACHQYITDIKGTKYDIKNINEEKENLNILVKDHELYYLGFGNKIRVVWSETEEYIGIAFGKNIGYNDGKIDSIKVIAESIRNGLCKVYLVDV